MKRYTCLIRVLYYLKHKRKYIYLYYHESYVIMLLKVSLVYLFLFINSLNYASESNGVKEPNRCEVCKYLATELNGKLRETGKTKEVIQTGHNILEPKTLKKIDYQRSELRLIESLEGICDRILEYNVHAERKGSFRYAKGRSETMQTLHGLKDKGVKVELGIPYEMWDLPSAEITIMKKQCENMIEAYEEVVETWYYHRQEESLLKYLCEDRVLSRDQRECLKEIIWDGKKVQDDENKEKNMKAKSPTEKKKSKKKGDDDEEKKKEETDKKEVRNEL